MKTNTITLCFGLAISGLSFASQAQAQMTSLRPPSVPLISHDPYFSVWSDADHLTDAPTAHWTGKTQALSSLIRIDGTAYRLMGDTPDAVPALTQTDVQVLPTRSIYTFAGYGLKVRLTFTSPLLPEDIELLSRPVTYVTWEVAATDGKTHEASLYLDASAALAVNDNTQAVVGSTENIAKLTALKIGSQAQPVLAKKGDNVRIDWGYFYLATPSKNAAFAIDNNDNAERNFAANTSAPGATTTDPGSMVAAITVPLGTIGNKTVVRHAILAYDDLYSIQFMGHDLRPYWRRNGADASTLLKSAEADYNKILKRCEKFDNELMADLTNAGGEKYAKLAALAYRQSYAAQKIVADDKGQPLSFSKENFSNGCIATVDVIYPAAPQMIALSPALLKASLEPIMLYSASSRWKWPFAPHDLGTYPKANGQVYGGGERTEENQMPVEETGNLMLLMGALSKVEGNTKFSDPFWPTMTKWADYLAQKGFDPENQLCTDDFAGHLAHNVNLSAKAIVALGAYAQMAQMRGETANAQKYSALAQKFAAQWVAAAVEGDHTRLAFDRPDSWSQKYNLVWDSILGLNLFPQSVYDREMAFYKSHLNAYGLPLDNRKDYTKLDWTIWSATLTGKKADLQTIVDPVYDWLSATSSRVPLTDWYDTKTARQSGFQARSVVGGVFLPMLKDGTTWKKWTSRDRNKVANWAPLPVPPVVTEVVSTGMSRAGVTWKYSTDAPAANWFSTAFDDSTWRSGDAGFGSAGTPTINVRTPWTSSDIWLRRTFQFNGADTKNVRIYGFHDEDAEIYLNGVLVGTASDFTSSYDLLGSLPAGALKAGTNVLAVHCHQTGGGQGIDIGFAEVN